MVEGGADIRFIQQLLGHEKLEATQIYTEVRIQQLMEVHERTHPARLRE
jgi:integrase/recombinase XerD